MNSRIQAGWSGQARAETICPSIDVSDASPPRRVQAVRLGAVRWATRCSRRYTEVKAVTAQL